MSFPKKMFSGAPAIALWTALFCFATFLFAPGVLNDGDTYWHIDAGRWMIDNRAVLRIDPFSFTFAGHPWQTHEWLAEILMALAYVGGGWSGEVAMFAAVFALTGYLLGRHLSRWLHSFGLIAVLELSLACIAGSLLARPHLFALPLLEIWTAGLIFAREENRAPSWGLIAVMLLWANLHSSFLFGLALAVPFAVEAVWENPAARTATAKAWGLFVLAAVAVCLITPHGIGGLLFPLKLTAMPSLVEIKEWAPAPLTGVQPFVLAAGMALMALFVRGAKIKPLRALLLIGLFYMALLHVRHQMLLAVVAPLLIAGPLAGETSASPWHVFRSAALGFAVLFAVLLGLRFAFPLVRADGEATPAAAFAHVPEKLKSAPVFNDYGFGGYLIFNDVRPFIDGRAELYGEKFVHRYVRIAAGDKAVFAATLKQYRIRWGLVSSGGSAAGMLAARKDWRRIYADKYAEVYVEDGAL